MKALSLAIAAAISIFGCVDQVLAADRVADADEAQVATCTYLQDVDGRSVFGERLKEQGLVKAKEDARAHAAKARATHVVWGKVSSTDVTTVVGKAYRCPQ
jgi:ABC-type Zn uptake system ZnuABC Zn-binding protein ZnuA